MPVKRVRKWQQTQRNVYRVPIFKIVFWYLIKWVLIIVKKCLIGLIYVNHSMNIYQIARKKCWDVGIYISDYFPRNFPGTARNVITKFKHYPLLWFNSIRQSWVLESCSCITLGNWFSGKGGVLGSFGWYMCSCGNKSWPCKWLDDNSIQTTLKCWPGHLTP